MSEWLPVCVCAVSVMTRLQVPFKDVGCIVVWISEMRHSSDVE